MFLINSRLGIFRCGPDLHQGRPYSEVTAAFLPSSLRTSHSFALVYSTKPPVSVYGTGSLQLSLEDFLGSALRIIYPGEPGHFSYAWTNVARIFLKLHPRARNTHPIMCGTYSTPSLHRIEEGHGILTVCPSRAAFAIRLGPTNPWLIISAKETLIFRRQGFSP